MIGKIIAPSIFSGFLEAVNNHIEFGLFEPLRLIDQVYWYFEHLCYISQEYQFTYYSDWESCDDL